MRHSVSKILVHICCAHCAAYTVEHWKGQGHEVGGFWYNPNIHPFQEHESRLGAARDLAARTGLGLIETEGYDMPEWFRRVADHEDERCRHCFTLRLDRTARAAREHGYDGFTSTLLISPHQDHELLREIGEQTAAAHGVDFCYADLRKHYSDSRHITKPMDLYRQQYCGCLFSEWERYREPGR
jgi:predicted adenine nucleotide alpha hydrolase (AANH) superfamily ATPase